MSTLVKIGACVGVFLVCIAAMVVGSVAPEKCASASKGLHDHEHASPMLTCADIDDDTSSPGEHAVAQPTKSRQLSDPLDDVSFSSNFFESDGAVRVRAPDFFVLVSWLDGALCVFMAMTLQLIVAKRSLNAVASSLLAQPIVALFERSHFQFRLSHQI